MALRTHRTPLRQEIDEVVDGQVDPERATPGHDVRSALDHVVGRVLQQRFGTSAPAPVQAIQDAEGALHRSGRHTQPAAPLQIAEERLQRFVEKLIRRLSRIDITDPGPLSRSTVELVDVQTP